MIENKQDLVEYISEDQRVQPTAHNPIARLLGGKIVKLKLHLRKCEYHHNVRQTLWHKVMYYYHLFRLRSISTSYCSEIPINVFGKGLVIWHAERIIVNSASKVGDYCSLSSGVVIAQAHDGCPTIGNHVELMLDSKVLGDINVADHVRIGANALVIKSIGESNTTWAGTPARKINDKGTVETPIPVARPNN